jgi:hypothetical protein
MYFEMLRSLWRKKITCDNAYFNYTKKKFKQIFTREGKGNACPLFFRV